jgi:hypothetical protein
MAEPLSYPPSLTAASAVVGPAVILSFPGRMR